MKVLALLITILGLVTPVSAWGARAKDIGSFYGVRENRISGPGLVIGLRRTGDSRSNTAMSRALANRLQGMGVSLDVDDVVSRNVALVMVSATLAAGSRGGSKLDALVASTGDASSLEGGILLMTPLMGPDGEVYAVAEGPLVVGGFTVDAGGSSARKNTPTVGRVVGGALVEREVAGSMEFDERVDAEFVLNDPDFTTALRLADAINRVFEADAQLAEAEAPPVGAAPAGAAPGEAPLEEQPELEVARVTSSSTLSLAIPKRYIGKFANFAVLIEATNVRVDSPARVVINERTGTVVMGADVEIGAVAVAHGGLTIEVQRQMSASQPAPLSLGTTTTISNSSITASEADGQLRVVEGTDIGQLVAALNAMDVKPRDLMIILQAIQAAGALHAEIVGI